MRTFKAILKDVENSCNDVLYARYHDNYADIIEAATKIYIAELEAESYRKTIDSLF